MSLSTVSLGYLGYLRRVLGQPTGSWDGFYAPLSPSMNFALRYQLAFGTYAVALMSQSTPAYTKPYAEAMSGAIEKMLDVAAWGYWHAAEESAGAGGHVAVLVSPHQRGPVGRPSDPVARDNLQYSGHLSTMLGLYEKVTGDTRYDEPFTLRDPASGAEYTYTHGTVAERIHRQMEENEFGGVCCEQGMAYVPCNNYALASNTLHDALHGTTYSAENARWLKTVRDRMVLKGPAARGVFGAAYVRSVRLAAPVALNFTDVWGLAFMLPFDRTLARELYTRFRKRGVVRDGERRAYVGSSSFSERSEISDVALNTGFGAILARGLGDTRLAEAFERYAASEFGGGWRGGEYAHWGAPRTLHSTSLFALAACLRPGADNFTRLFAGPSGQSDARRPYLQSVDDPSGRVGVAEARWDQNGNLHAMLVQVGSPGDLRDARSVEAAVTLADLPDSASVLVDGHDAPRERSFRVEVPPKGGARIEVTW